ncbi:hypothetical protein OG800_50415 (plasmid) [Streptomyces sp. NBC_00445]
MSLSRPRCTKRLPGCWNLRALEPEAERAGDVQAEVCTSGKAAMKTSA